MKNFYTFLVCILASTLFSFNTPSTSDFEGKLVFDISIDGANMPEQAKAMFQGSKFTIFVKGMMTRIEMEMAMQNTISISNRKANTTVTLMDIMGNKYMIKKDINKKEDKTPDISVKELSETKTIAGYLCKKAEILLKDKTGKEHSTFVFYTDEIANQLQYDSKSNYLKGIKGMPLEYEIISPNGMIMKMTAKTVSKEEVADSKFEIPAGYKETTTEDLQKEMMKMMQQQH